MEEERNIVARAKIMDIISITAVVGAITGCASLCWNIITYTGFNLGIYSYFLAFKRADAILHKEFLMTLGHIKNINNYSDDAITLNGWFTLLLRKEGQRFNNHHVDGFSLVMSKALKDALSNILAEPPSYIPLFPSSETKDLRLLEETMIDC